MNEMLTSCVDVVVEHLLVGSVTALILVPLAWAISKATRIRTAVYRHMIWLYCMIGIVALPLIWLYGPKMTVTVLPARAEPPRAVRLPEMIFDGARASAQGQSPAMLRQNAEAVEVAPASDMMAPAVIVKTALAGVWLIGFAFMLVRLAVGWHRLHDICQSATAVPCGELLGRTNRRAPKVLLTTRLRGPVCFGVVRPIILLPRDIYRGATPNDLHMVLAHELAHIERGDCWTNLFQRIVEATFFFHPLVWLASRRLTHEREEICDNHVLAQGASVDDYTGLLGDIGEQALGKRYLQTVALFEGQLLVRIRSLLDPLRGRQTRLPRRVGVACTFVVLAGFLVFGSVRLAAKANEADTGTSGPDAPSALTDDAEASAPTQQRPARSLHDASASGDIEQVKALIAAGAHVDAKDDRERSALHRAAHTGHVEVAKLLIEHGANVNAEDNLKRTPLEHAAVASRTHVVKLLLEKGANPNARNESGDTPLQVAVFSARADTVAALIDGGADVTLRDEDGLTPMYAAIISPVPGRREIVELIAATGKEPSTIHLAAYLGDLDKVRAFLTEGVGVDEKGAGDGTGLHYASAGGQAEVMAFLLAQGADVNAKAMDDLTPLHAAVGCSDSKEAIELLLANGADVSAETTIEEGMPMSALDVWFIRCLILPYDSSDLGEAQIMERIRPLLSSEVTQLLISKGAKLDSGTLWLPIAAVTGMTEMVDMAIAHGADVNAKSELFDATALQMAVGEGRDEVVERLITKGADIHVTTPEGQTLLHLAAIEGHKTTAELLIAKGTDVNAKDNRGATPLWYAEDSGHAETAALLREHGAKKEAPAVSLHEAAANGDIEQVKALIAQGAEVNAKDENGQTPLLLALNRDHLEVAELLVSSGADVDALDGRTGKPLLLSVGGRKKRVEFLLSKGADIEAKDGNGLTLLNLIAAYSNERDYLEVIELLLEKGADIEARGYGDCTPLQAVAEVGRKEAAEFLLVHGARVDAAPGRFFGTAVHQAMRGGHKDMVRWCLSHGLEIPPLHQAAYFGQTGKVRSLLNTGGDVNQEDAAGFTALHCAVFGRNAETVKLLIDNGADVEASNAGHATLLLWACEGGYLDIVKLLVDNGAEVNGRAFGGLMWGPMPMDNWSNLHAAAHMGHADVVEYLLTKGADINAKCIRGDGDLTPLHFAARKGHVDVVKALLARGANANLKSKEGHTALDLAKEENHADVVALLGKLDAGE